MIQLLLAMALSTLLTAWEFWRWVVQQRRAWQKEQARRQEMLMRVDVAQWTDHVAWTLATTGESVDLECVRPLPKPTLLHMEGLPVPWVVVLLTWLVYTLVCWVFFALVIKVQRPSPAPSVVYEVCAQRYARWPKVISACCRRVTGVPCPVPGR